MVKTACPKVSHHLKSLFLFNHRSVHFLNLYLFLTLINLGQKNTTLPNLTSDIFVFEPRNHPLSHTILF